MGTSDKKTDSNDNMGELLAALAPAQIEAHYIEFVGELADKIIVNSSKLREQNEIRASEEEMKKIRQATLEELEELIASMPEDMPFPDWFDRFLTEKRDDQARERREEYELKRVERKRLYEAQMFRHAKEWETVLSLKLELVTVGVVPP